MPAVSRSWNPRSRVVAGCGSGTLRQKRIRPSAPGSFAMLLRQLKEGRRPFHRAAAAYALGDIHSKRAVPGFGGCAGQPQGKSACPRSSCRNAGSLICESIDPGPDKMLTRFVETRPLLVRLQPWCSGHLNQRKAAKALPTLRKVAASDRRTVPGFWSVADECQWAILRLEGREKEAAKLELRLEKQSVPPKPSPRKRKAQTGL